MVVIYVGLIVLANLFGSLWILHLPFGISGPAGVFFIAPIFTLRDRIQLTKGVKYVYGLIVTGAVVSLLIGLLSGLHALERVAMAGLIAYVVSELMDTLIFSKMKQSIVKRILGSNVVSTALDSLLFITIGFGFIPMMIIGQWFLKMAVSTAVIPVTLYAQRKWLVPLASLLLIGQVQAAPLISVGTERLVGTFSEQRVTVYLREQLNSKMALSGWGYIGQYADLGYASLVYSPADRFEVSAGVGIHKSLDPLYLAASASFRDPRASFLGIYEWAKDTYFYKTKILLYPIPLIGVGALSQRFDGAGPLAELRLGKITTWGSALWWEDDSRYLIGVTYTTF